MAQMHRARALGELPGVPMGDGDLCLELVVRCPNFFAKACHALRPLAPTIELLLHLGRAPWSHTKKPVSLLARHSSGLALQANKGGSAGGAVMECGLCLVVAQLQADALCLPDSLRDGALWSQTIRDKTSERKASKTGTNVASCRGGLVKQQLHLGSR